MLWRGMRQQRDPPSPRGCFAGQGASIDPCCASESNSPRRVAKSRERLSEAGMVDLLGMFRRRPAKRNPPGFARTRGDITSLEDAMEMLQQNQVRDAPPLARDGSRGAAPPRQETRQEARQPEKPRPRAKTNVFYMITGLIKADRGAIELDGHDVTSLPMYQRARLGIGYLPQEASIFRGLTVEQNIRAVLEVVEPNRKKREAELNALLDEFNIGRLRKTPSIALSGGERRRVEIARALATRPNYMLLDEPFAGIDPIAVGDIQDLVRHLTNRG